MNEERKQGKNKGKNKQTDERPKHTSTKGHKMNTHTSESMEEWKEEKGKTNNEWTPKQMYKWYENPVQYINPLTPKSDQYLISPYNITSESHINVMRIKEMITN